MQLMSQITEETTRVLDAASEHGYEAMLLALIVLSSLVFFGWLLRQIMLRHLAVEERILSEAKSREDRLAKRVDDLENKYHEVLISVIRQNSEVMGKVLVAIENISRASEKLVSSFERISTICPLLSRITEDSEKKV